MKAKRNQTAGRYPTRTVPRRILVVSSHFPYPPTNGSALRLWALLRGLAANGHEVDLLAFGDPEETQVHLSAVLSACRGVEVVPHARVTMASRLDLGRRLLSLLSSRPYGAARSGSAAIRAYIGEAVDQKRVDAILCEENDQLVNIPSSLPVPLIVDNQNAEFVMVGRYRAQERNRIRSAYAAVEAWKLRRWEQAACRRADVSLVCSEVDRAIFHRLCPDSPIAVVPNVIDTGLYKPVASATPGMVLYTGGMDWFPNRDAVQYFARSVLPFLRRLVPGVRFVVAGRSGPDEFRREMADVPELSFTGTVADIRTEIGRAEVCVVPLRIGSGTRLKILEAAAMAKPIVSTRVGAEGLDFADGREIMLADDPEKFAQAVAAFLAAPGRRVAFGQAARYRVLTDYSLTALSTALRRVMVDLAGVQARGAGR